MPSAYSVPIASDVLPDPDTPGHRHRSPQRHVDVDIPQVVVPGPAHADDRGQGSRPRNITSRHTRQFTAIHQRVDVAGVFLERHQDLASRS